MKKLTAIFFLLIVVFNFYGYRLLINYMQLQQTNYLAQKLDRQLYNDYELISIKTTLNLPYYSSSPEFERTYGSITIDGIDYEYVKKRVYKDTLELLCIPNHEKTKMQWVTNELTKILVNGENSIPLKKTTTIKICLPDFCQSAQTASFSFSMQIKQQYLPIKDLPVSPGYLVKQEKPPRSMQV